MFLKFSIFATLIIYIAAYRFLSCPCGEHSFNKTGDENRTDEETEPYEIEVINVDDSDEFCVNHMNESKTTGFCSSFKYVYNPYKDIVRRRSMIPVCIRCALCVAIANEVRLIFDNLIVENQHIEPSCAKLVVNNLFDDEFCKYSFCSHDLRQCEDETMITKMSDCGSHIRTDYDGQWPKLLRDMCLVFVDQLDADSKYDLFIEYKSKRNDIEEFLCRGYGVFRECTNLPGSSTKSKPTKSYWASCFF